MLEKLKVCLECGNEEGHPHKMDCGSRTDVYVTPEERKAYYEELEALWDHFCMREDSFRCYR